MLVFERGLQLNDQREIYIDHNFSLLLNKDFHLIFNNHVFFDAFNCEFYVRKVFPLYHVDFSELSLSDFAYNVEILKLCLETIQ